MGPRTSDGLDELLDGSLNQVGSWKNHSMRYVKHVAGRGSAHVLSGMVGVYVKVLCCASSPAPSTKPRRRGSILQGSIETSSPQLSSASLPGGLLQL